MLVTLDEPAPSLTVGLLPQRITHYSLLITHYSLLITHYSLLITHHYHAHAYASVRGSVPALITLVFGSMTMAANEPLDHGPVTCNL